jgi:hypothetical protein
MRRSRAKSYRKLHRTCCAVKSSPRRRRSMEHSSASGCLVDQLSKAGPSCTTIIKLLHRARHTGRSPLSGAPLLQRLRPFLRRDLKPRALSAVVAATLLSGLTWLGTSALTRMDSPAAQDVRVAIGMEDRFTVCDGPDSPSATTTTANRPTSTASSRPSSASAWRSSTSSAPASIRASPTSPPPSRSSRPRPSTSRATSWAGARTSPTCSSRRSTSARSRPATRTSQRSSSRAGRRLHLRGPGRQDRSPINLLREIEASAAAAGPRRPPRPPRPPRRRLRHRHHRHRPPGALGRPLQRRSLRRRRRAGQLGPQLRRPLHRLAEPLRPGPDQRQGARRGRVPPGRQALAGRPRRPPRRVHQRIQKPSVRYHSPVEDNQRWQLLGSVLLGFAA